MKFIKGFDKNLCCRGMQYEIGKEYKTAAKDDNLSICSSDVLHFCRTIEQVNPHYNVKENNRFCGIDETKVIRVALKDIEIIERSK